MKSTPVLKNLPKANSRTNSRQQTTNVGNDTSALGTHNELLDDAEASAFQAGLDTSFAKKNDISVD